MKYVIIGLIIFSIPILTNAAVLTDFSSYSNPATVNFTSSNPSSGCVLYKIGTTYPVAYMESAGCGASGTLNTISWNAGSFNGTIDGSYMFVEANIAGCGAGNQPPNGYTYAQCSSANTGMPGVNEADFTITTGGGGGDVVLAAGLNTPDDIFKLIAYDISYILLLIVIVAIFIIIFKHAVY